MGHNNSTANLSLPQFIGTDKPTWLGDVNGAFLAIDGYAGTNDAAVAAAASDASSALSQANAAVNTANNANTTAGNASTAANNAVGVANTANAIAGTVDAKVGLLADLNTTDRTSIVNAINEVLGLASPGSVSIIADGIKTTSQLFDELYALIDPSKITVKSVFKKNTDVFYMSNFNPGNSYTFTNTNLSIGSYSLWEYEFMASGSASIGGNNGTIVDGSTYVQPSGTVLEIIY